jgi:hypothetical protein
MIAKAFVPQEVPKPSRSWSRGANALMVRLQRLMTSRILHWPAYPEHGSLGRLPWPYGGWPIAAW